MHPAADTNICCSYCGRSLRHVRSFFNNHDENISLARCLVCRAEHLVPQPSDALLSKQYAAYYERRVGDVKDAKNLYFRRLIKSLVRIIRYPERVVDLGAGEGFFAEEFVRIFPDARVDVVDQCGVPKASYGLLGDRVRAYTSSLEEWLDRPPERNCYDLVTALDVIEHVRDPKGFISRISKALLKPGGILMLTTPNSGSVSRMVLGRFWPHYKVEHITYPTPTALRNICREAGLEVVSLRVLIKLLPVGYCLNVLSGFGPEATRRFGGFLNRSLPSSCKSSHIMFPTGELIVCARRPI
jgi:2-polyprenyl-3-methyl-5-hydroxy-6-metoxy-1,4-benzoquinol methylase